MKTKKIFIIVLSLIMIFGIVKLPKIKRYFAEERYYGVFSALNIVKPCFNPYKQIKDVFVQEGFDYIVEDGKVVSDSLKKITDKSVNIEDKFNIPTITHQIYFSPTKANISILKDFYVEKLKANFTKLSSINNNWQHNIWTNNPDIFPKEIKEINGVVIRDISEFNDHALYPYLIEALEKANNLPAYLAESSDLMRLLVLQKLGGIYNDMDYEIYNAAPLIEYMKKFDFIGGREKINSISYYANSFLAAKPNHPVINEAVLRMIRNYRQDANDPNTPDYVKYPCTENDRLYFNGPPLITLAYFAKNNIEGNNDLILPSWMILNISFAHYKNKFCDYSKITKEDFIKNNNNLLQLIKGFNDNFKEEALEKDYAVANSNGQKETEHNIYYNLKYRNDYNIIGADMGCGTWVTAKNPRHWYWK